MRAHFLTAKERKAAASVAQGIVAKNLDDVANRAQYLWMCGMLNAGFDADDVKKVIAEMPYVMEKYEGFKADKCADFALVSELRAHGVPVENVRCEM